MPKTYLPDVNVWLAFTFDPHFHHLKAKTWFNVLASDEVCHFCRLTQQGFLRLATNPSVFGKHAVTLPEAWKKYDTLLSDARVTFSDEPPALESYWRRLTQHQMFSPKVWNDAYIASFAQAGSLEVVTLDKAFTQYAVTCTIL